MLAIKNMMISTLKDVEGYDNHEEVAMCHDSDSGLEAIIAIHNTKRGPAFGGCRYWSYKNFGNDGLTDALRLSRGMTYKSALALVPVGGGKAVINKTGQLAKGQIEAQLRAFGRFVDTFAGRYFTGEDVGTSVGYMKIVAEETAYVVGILPKKTADGSMRDGDPSLATAYGVVAGIRAAVWHKFGLPSLENVTVAIQGCGHVGRRLAHDLAAAGARLIVADIDTDARDRVVDECHAIPCEPAEIYAADAQVFAPCALGSVINEKTLPMLKADIVAGSANNQLKDASFGNKLMQRGILYAPDYVINAGGLIDVSYDYLGNFDRGELLEHLDGIGDTLMEIFKLSEARQQSTNEIAMKIAEERLLPPEKLL